jgi:hypothetical protein
MSSRDSTGSGDQVLSVRMSGIECPHCGRLDPSSFVLCPVCDTPTRPIHDLFHRAMGVARERAARVEVLHRDTAERLRASGDGLGALLRSRRLARSSGELARLSGA